MRIFLLTLALALAGCAGARGLETASTLPEAVFHNATLDSVRERLAAGCQAFGGRLDQTPSPNVVCVKDMGIDDWNAALWNVEAGLTTPPLHYLEFMTVEIGPDVRVVARQYGQTRPPLGVSKRFEMDRATDLARAQKLLTELAAAKI